jgi:bacterioferritin
MKGDETLLTKLNQLLADDLIAISQYIFHSQMCENSNYGLANQTTGAAGS